MASYEDQLLKPEERVLSTLEADGSRRWLFPRLAKGRFWHARRIVGYALIALFIVLPFIYINGKPAMLLDIAARRFYLFGFTFLPTDTVLLALLMLGVFLTIFFITALLGRVWCGWGCPQTVYLEFVFRPIQRLWTGRAGVGGKPKPGLPAWRYAGLYLSYIILCFLVANIFLAYFVGVEKLATWMTQSPFANPTGFLVVAFVTGLMFYDFAYWREQMCIIGCPYGRFQSVMLDRSSLIISYDEKRGEPRGKPKKPATVALPVVSEPTSNGDCIDCTMCVQVCPTGIDIRKGLQLECVACAQCIDACDSIMDKINKPRGLIRYSSQKAMAGEKTGILRPRVIIYGLIISIISTLFLFVFATRAPADIVVLRAPGLPFFVHEETNQIENIYQIRITNRTESERTYHIALTEPAFATMTGATGPLIAQSQETIDRGASAIHIRVPREEFSKGPVRVQITVTDDQGYSRSRFIRLNGPTQLGVKP